MIKLFQNKNTTSKSLNSKPLFMSSSCFLGSYVLNLILTYVMLYVVLTLSSPAGFSASSIEDYTFVQMLYIIMPALILSIAVLPLVCAKIQNFSIIRDYKIRWCGIKNIICAVILGVLLMMLMVNISAIFVSVLEYFGISLPQPSEPTAETFPQFIAEMICIALFPAIFEELFVRGYLRKNLENYFNKTTVILITALLFAFLHGSLNSLLPTFVAGLYLAYLVYRTNSIIPSMIVHFTNNALITCISYFSNFTETEQATESAIVTLEELYIAIVPFAVIAIALFGISLFVMNFCKKIPSPNDDEIVKPPKYRAHPLAWVLFGCCFVFSIILYII